ncbi:LysR family transcriptional regulator [Novosphingobium sp. 11B]
MNRADLADFTYFLAIAQHCSFRRAGLELGVTASAISHGLKGLEQRLGVRLVNRTNRSVTLTAAGDQLRDALTRPFEEIGQAVDDLNRFREAPSGRIRLNVVADAARNLLGPVMGPLAERYPDLEIEIVASNRIIDIVGEGFDAGIRHGGTVPEDMVAQRLSADLRWIVAGSPDYLERHGTPMHPDDLQHHRCIGVKLGNDQIYRWEFMREDGEFGISVPSKLVADDSATMMAMAISGAGLTYGTHASMKPMLEAGLLRQVLADWATIGGDYHIYYPSRRQVPAGLKALINLIREIRPLGL